MNEPKDLSEVPIDVWTTGMCDMECPFCYGAEVPIVEKGVKIYFPDELPRRELSLEQSKITIDTLYTAGIRKLNISGGEPLMRLETPEIIRYAKDKGIAIYLSTDGTFLKRRYAEIKDNIEVMGLPLDGHTPELNGRMGRREYVLANVTSFLNAIVEKEIGHKIKLGTVVSSLNIEHLKDIGNLIFRNPSIRKPDVWRVYKFEPIGRGSENNTQYEIDDAAFDNAITELRLEFPEVQISSKSSSNGKYFFVTPDGMLQTIEDNRRVSKIDMLNATSTDVYNLIASEGNTITGATQNRNWWES